MPERTVIVASRIGLHARPAALFTHAASAIGAAVTITNSADRSVNAASILGVLSLGIDYGHTVTLKAEGEGADAALDTLARMLETDLDAD